MSNTVTYTWKTTGPFTVTVTAQNLGSAAHIISVAADKYLTHLPVIKKD